MSSFIHLQNVELKLRKSGDKNESESFVVTPELIIDDIKDDKKENTLRNVSLQILIHAIIIVYSLYVLYRFISSK